MKNTEKPKMNKIKNRKTWVGLKPRKEATKKERIEKARNKHRGSKYEY